MGVRRIAGTDGCTIDPPAAKEYAVDPVGVAIITPSPCHMTIINIEQFRLRSDSEGNYFSDVKIYHLNCG